MMTKITQEQLFGTQNLLPETDPLLMDLFTPIEDDENYAALCNQLGDKSHAYHSIKMSRFAPFGMWQNWTRIETGYIDFSPIVVPQVSYMTGEVLVWAHKDVKDIPSEYLESAYHIIAAQMRSDKEWLDEFICGHLSELAEGMGLSEGKLVERLKRDGVDC
ncbi:hypothetical protein [Aliivibrio salmonicida]|uniref:hypothetical protein n=1 Tax=Aliivibrio salmonicida TaxID=40269 RepID=UPI003D0976DD